MTSHAPRVGLPVPEVPPTLFWRVRSEYLEMPGLRLTPRQATRLWGVDHAMAEHVLAALVECGFLRRNREGAYLRRSER